MFGDIFCENDFQHLESGGENLHVRTIWKNKLIHENYSQMKTKIYNSVFQLGLFLRALRPVRTGLRPARFSCALPELKKKKIYI